MPPTGISSWYPTIGNMAGGVLGGIGGALLGGAGGAAAGTAVEPGGGTVVGGVGGGIGGEELGQTVGSGIGQGIGKAAQDFQNHVDLNPINIGENILGGAATGAAGVGIGKGLGWAAGKLGDTLGSFVPRLLQNQLQPGLKAVSANTDIPKLMDNLSRGAGIHDASQISKVLDIVNNAITPQINKIVGGITLPGSGSGTSNAAADGLVNMTLNLLQTDAGSGVLGDPGTTTAKGTTTKATGDVGRVLNTVKQAATAAFGDTGQIGEKTGTDALGAVKSLEDSAAAQFNNAYDSSGQIINQAAHSMGKIYSLAADQIEEMLTHPGGAIDATGKYLGGTPAGLSDEARQAVLDGLEPLKSLIPQAHSYFSNLVSGAEDIPELRSIMSDLVNGKNAYSAAQGAASRSAGIGVNDIVKMGSPLAAAGTGFALGGPVGGAAGLAAGSLPAILSSNAADKAGGPIMTKIASILNSPGMKLATKGAGIVGSGLMSDIPTALGSNPQVSQAAQAPQNPQAPANTNQPVGGVVQPQNPLQQSYGQDLSDQGILMGDISQAPAALAGSLGGAVSGLGQSAANLAPEVQKQQLAAALLEQILQAYKNSPKGSQSILQSLLPGSAASAYNREAAGVPGALGTALGVPASQAGQLRSVLPSLLTTGNVGTQQQSALQQLIQSLGGQVPAGSPQ